MGGNGAHAVSAKATATVGHAARLARCSVQSIKYLNIEPFDADVVGRSPLGSASGLAGEPRLFNTKQIDPLSPPERAQPEPLIQLRTAP